MVSEALVRSFMDFQLSCTSHLPWIWVMETLARSSQVDIALLLGKHGVAFCLVMHIVFYGFDRLVGRVTSNMFMLL